MSNPAPLVSVIIPNFNGRGVLNRAIESVLCGSYPNLELIVVDNGSEDDSLDAAIKAFGDDPRLRCVRSETNTGYAGGCNLGASSARGRLLAFLNNDAVAEPDWLAELVRAADEHPEAGILISRVLPERIPGKTEIGALDYWGFSCWQEVDLSSDASKPVIASGAAFLIKMATWETIGGFDDAFFLYVEDVDLSLRALLQGYASIVAFTSLVTHVGGWSTAKLSSARRRYFVYRNTIRALAKSLTFPAFCFRVPVTVTVILTESFLATTVRGESAYLRSFLSAIAWNLSNLSGTLRLRRNIQSGRKVSQSAVDLVLLRRPPWTSIMMQWRRLRTYASKSG